MTEKEWLTSNQPSEMMSAIQDRLSNRKTRLFLVACCRAVGPLLSDPRSQAAVDVAERVADGLATDAERRAARQAALVVEEELLTQRGTQWTPEYQNFSRLILPVQIALFSTRLWMGSSPRLACNMDIGVTALHSLIRCVFGNPFRPGRFEAAWLTSTVVALANGIYAERAFDRMPILADALQDAGCDNDEILDHCRGDGPHVRGCWVVDPILGKS